MFIFYHIFKIISTRDLQKKNGCDNITLADVSRRNSAVWGRESNVLRRWCHDGSQESRKWQGVHRNREGNRQDDDDEGDDDTGHRADLNGLALEPGDFCQFKGNGTPDGNIRCPDESQDSRHYSHPAVRSQNQNIFSKHRKVFFVISPPWKGGD